MEKIEVLQREMPVERMALNALLDPATLTDSYKVTHWKQYPPGTRKVYSYFESRGGKFREVTFFGLQYVIQSYLKGCVVDKGALELYNKLYFLHFGRQLFNYAGWLRIAEEFGGKLPIRIKAVKEGMTIPRSNVMMTVENTHPDFFWLTNYVESLLVQNWYPNTVCSLSREVKKVIMAALVETGTPETIDFKFHDFGFRGSTSVESSLIGDVANLVNFKGTDTITGLLMAYVHYHGDSVRIEDNVFGFSVPASEHSTITSWGKENEIDACRNMLQQYPDGIVACVSDSYDVYRCCREIWGDKLKDIILAREGVLVVRPDSGDPKEVVVKVLQILGEKFGFVYNDKGYKVLPPQIRVIQGDGISYDSIVEIIEEMKKDKWSMDNVTFGCGGKLIQAGIDRDTNQFAFKCSQITFQDETGLHGRDVFKDPVTDSGKKSKTGRLALVMDGIDSYKTIHEEDAIMTQNHNLLETVFEDGEMIRRQSLEEIRKLAQL